MTIRPVVLAVDDDPRVLGVYQAILETRYEVLTAPDGRAALDVLQHRTVDVVLLDMMMPGLNGLGVLDALRRLGIETNVVMVSAVNDSETALEALRLGACDYLTKPFGLSELERVVRRLTEHGVAGAPTAGRSRALPHALIVGGDPGFRASLAVALRTRGRVDAVESALAARGVLARTLPDVIVAGDDAAASALCAETMPIVVTDARRPDLQALLGAVVEAFGIRHKDVRPFAAPLGAVIAHVGRHCGCTTVEAIAEAAGLSPGALARVFTEQMEMTLREYVTHVQSEAARPELAKMFRRHADSTAVSYRATT